ncbi:PREDICTED: ciliogenesis-associated TTC17-interacting protein [Gekko japonicus]|uniref:Ciliogenesis-associated TTC17-interacting protein n=1 Tax=Gekko japonicus TaxID=146911 RepID=A0ABM1JVL9_GEKJA|nr:PREDICTED: ciliogenesis-associated TTC17-interacting protein [Gekko japonicus]
MAMVMEAVREAISTSGNMGCKSQALADTMISNTVGLHHSHLLAWRAEPLVFLKVSWPLFNYPALDSEEAATYEELVKALMDHFAPRPSKMALRMDFFHGRRFQNSSLQAFRRYTYSMASGHLQPTVQVANSLEIAKETPIQKVPNASKSAIEFLSLIGTDEIQPCLFEESLVAVSENGQRIGTFSISVKRSRYSLDEGYEEDCYLVHARSKGTVDGVPCTTSITGYVTKNLETLEQHTEESVRFREHPVETRTHVVKHQGQTVVTKTIIERDEEIHVSSSSYKCELLQGLVAESANLLVLRVMARRQAVPENAIFLSFDSDHHVCTSTYRALGFQKQQVKKEEVDVFVIERAVHSIEGVPLGWQFCFLSDGHLSRRVQVGSPVIMLIEQVPILIEIDKPDPHPIFEKIPLDWEEDMELYSQFLDRKEELQASHATYARRHPELSNLLADFLQLLLLRKPDDVVTFAAEYFAPFSVQNPPCRSFQSSDKPSPFRSHV